MRQAAKPDSWNPLDADACKGCGLCCMHMRTPPFIPVGGDKSYNALPKNKKRWLRKWIESPRWMWLDKHIGEDCPCVWLDMETGRCTHHEIRPRICIEYEVGCEACLKLRKEFGLSVPV
ncbi:MAG: YkgJ family cysteine cluster protein [Phycisphaerae bacterium]|nr:YkgJ family cysteine cluster protein [Phycisphaerae bacterium]